MGRYAFFSTGVEYKFAFGEQPSSDIEMFGGVISNDTIWNANITWKQEDLPKIKKVLGYLLFSYDLETFNIEEYPKNIEGTYVMRRDLEKKLSNREGYSTILGCIIYHQLLYNATLSCKYER